MPSVSFSYIIRRHYGVSPVYLYPKVMKVAPGRFSPRAISGSRITEKPYRFCLRSHVYLTVWIESHVGLTGGDCERRFDQESYETGANRFLRQSLRGRGFYTGARNRINIISSGIELQTTRLCHFHMRGKIYHLQSLR